MNWTDRLRHVAKRRRALIRGIDVPKEFETWEETCVPSYVHANWAAAAVSWWRLFAAVELARGHLRGGPVLDFGSSVGELGHLLPAEADYWFIEQEEPAAHALMQALPHARRTTLQDAPDGHFQVVFALDSLEHNPDHDRLLEALRAKLAPSGVLVLSGPTENALYRLGRRIARFDAHYHETNIHAIEATAQSNYERVATRTVPLGVPLFRVSVWRAPGIR
ncbi:MAG: class I SAM-dependent methyltransferase [Myxococcales bacterium]|nr:class I SAM-dependent methyltransferase [Myxococcales bacterium]